MEKTCGVYRIKNIVNNKFYIGSSQEIEDRFTTHRRLLRDKKHHNPHLQNAWHKYGAENFVFEIVEICDKSDLHCKEQFYLDNTHALTEGYNMAPIANLPPMTEETKRKIGDANRGRPTWNKGGKATEETKLKMSISAKKNNWMNGRKGELAPRFNVKVEQSSREKMRSAKLGKLNNASSKPIFQILDDKRIALFPSAKDAQRKTGIDAKNIASVLKSKRLNAGGFRWEYASISTVA